MLFDWTIHVSDVVTFGSLLGGGCLYVARALRKSYRQITGELEIHHEELVDHRSVLQKMGWRPDPVRGLSRDRGAI